MPGRAGYRLAYSAVTRATSAALSNVLQVHVPVEGCCRSHQSARLGSVGGEWMWSRRKRGCFRQPFSSAMAGRQVPQTLDGSARTRREPAKYVSYIHPRPRRRGVGGSGACSGASPPGNQPVSSGLVVGSQSVEPLARAIPRSIRAVSVIRLQPPAGLPLNLSRLSSDPVGPRGWPF